jgi:tetratricopeptide (TPR) repeat protein
MSGLYLGRLIKSGKQTADKYYLNKADLTTHIFICGSTGSGKTVLGKCLIEEALLNQIPAVVIDLKGDLSSLKVPLYDLGENEVEDFVEGSSDEDRTEKVRKNLAEFKLMLSNSGLDVKDVRNFRNRTNIRIFTPKSRVYEEFSISFLTSPPDNFDEIMRNEPETILNHISNQASVIFKRLFGEAALITMSEEKTLIECAILHLYKNGVELEGRAGIVNLIKTIYEVPFERIGMLKVREFISEERKMVLIRRLNTLLVGADSLWYDGESIDSIINSLVNLEKKPEDKTNLYIFNLSMLDNFDDRNLVLSNIAVTLFNRMKRLGDSREPRALFYIDEIGGGKLSFFPDDPIQNESKSSINLLLRQGRAFGLGCILATQNPGDIDYRGLTNCHTWYVGKLLTKADREKVIQGIAASSYFLDTYESFVKMAGGGDFIAKTKEGTVITFKERWLLSFHKVLTYNDLVTLKKTLLFADDLILGADLLAKKEFNAALPYFESVLLKEPDSQKAMGLTAECYFALGSHIDAINYLDRVLKSKQNEYSIARAYYFMGEIARAAAQNDKALDFFQRSIKIDAQYADSYFSMADIYYKNQRTAEALQNIQKYVVLKPAIDNGYYLMAGIYIAMQDYMAADNAVKKAINNLKDSSLRYPYKFLEARINYYLGQNAHSLELIEEAKNIARGANIASYECDYLASLIFMRFKEYERAVASLEKVIAADPADQQALVSLADLYYQTKNNEKLIETLKRLEKINPDAADIFAYNARLLLDSGKTEEALALVVSRPQNASGADKLLAVKGLIYNALNKKEEALAAFKQAVEFNPRSVEGLYMLSKNYEACKEYENQRNALLKAIECQAEEKFYYDLGLCYEKLNQYPQALDAFSHLYLSVLSDPEINLKKAEWHKKNNNTAKAHECVELFIKARPRAIDGYLIKGEIYTVERKYEEAIEEYYKAERISADDARLWFSRAFTYKEMGDYVKAEDCDAMARSKI